MQKSKYRHLTRNSGLALSVISLVSCVGSGNHNKVVSKPNIVIIYIDDLGFGDIGVNGAQGLQTPNIDRMAQRGINFTDAHCSAATCTPSRFSLLTGNAFRSNAAILPGDAPLLINPEKGTLPSMLQKAGYTTGVIGKWHLGLGKGLVNWNEEIKPGPREIGFDYSFLVPATLDRVPTVFIENQKMVNLDLEDTVAVNYNHKVGNLPTGIEHPEMLKMKADVQHSGTIIDSISRIGYMSGGKKAWWKDEDIADVLVDQVKTFIRKNSANPFFLYFAITDIHVPRAPNSRFVGKSTMGPRGDAIAEMDWTTGEVLKTLDELGLSENTLVIFSSDNGPILDDGYSDQAEEMLGNDNPAGPFRGAKYSIFEAGTRMPTVVYWPGTVNAGSSSAMLTQVDLYASLAKLVGQKVEPGDAPDSEDHLDAWLGRSEKGREYILEEAYTVALRKGDWKFILPQTGNTPDWLKNKKIDSGLSNEIQLYNLKNDIREEKNVAPANPKIVDELSQKLKSILK